MTIDKNLTAGGRELTDSCQEFDVNLPADLRSDRRRTLFLRQRLEQVPPRVKVLYRDTLANIDPEQISARLEAAALKFAEVTVAAERVRFDLLTAEKADADMATMVVRLEGIAHRSAADLDRIMPKPLTDWERRQRQLDRDEAAERRQVKRQRMEAADGQEDR